MNNVRCAAERTLYSMILKSGYRFSLATNTERVCSEIMCKTKSQAG
jgi:hypothetical protein